MTIPDPRLLVGTAEICAPKYSQDGWPGEGNIDKNPFFADPDNDDLTFVYRGGAIVEHLKVAEPFTDMPHLNHAATRRLARFRFIFSIIHIEYAR